MLDSSPEQAQFVAMNVKESELRTLIRDSHLLPVRIYLDDGKSYTIVHPDFAMVTDNALLLANGPGRELGDVSFVICYFAHIVRIERLREKSSAPT